jgi:uncharacterized protein (DUF1501 family)
MNYVELQRRGFLKLAGAAGAAGLGLSTLAHMNAAAQTTSGAGGYKALVCLFMYGGNDGNNLLVPLGTNEFAQYQRARTNLALARASLLPIQPSNTPGQSFGLHPAVPGLQSLFEQGHAAILTNIGTLAAPTTKAQLQSRSVTVPDNLYSHSDQQAQWQSAIVDQAPRSGWGGRMVERLLADEAANRCYGLVSVAGSNLWENSDRSLAAYKVSASGDFGFDFYDPASSDPLSAAIAQTLAESRAHLMEKAWTDVVARSVDNQRILTSALSGAGLTTAFPDTGLGRQLLMVARLVSARAQLGLTRQCFFCSIGGFDTHGDDQLQRQTELLGEISTAVSAFYAATVELGMQNNVTLFTGSDFGRTFQSNGQGSDHAWGSHHFVVGGAVKGGQLVGRYPNLTVNGPDDAGDGKWIPGVAVDQLGATLGKWFGAGSALNEIFPRLPNFDADLGFMAAA